MSNYKKFEKYSPYINIYYLGGIKKVYDQSILNQSATKQIDYSRYGECSTSGYNDLRGLQSLHQGKDSLAKRFEFTRIEELYDEMNFYMKK